MNNSHDLRSEAEKAAESIQDSTSHIAADAARAVADVRRTLRANATSAKERASDMLLTTAESMRAEAVKSDNDELIRQSQGLARSMEKAALYLDSRTVDQLGDEARETVKQNMWPTVAVVAFIGFLLGLLVGGGQRKSS